MINFVVVTDTPARLASFLEARGIIEKVTGEPGGTRYIGVRPGMEWVEVSNPIMTDPGSGGDPLAPGYVPPTFDTRHVYLVKFAHESEAEKSGDFRAWLMANTTPQVAPPNYTINGVHMGSARKVNGEQVWLMNEGAERFGTWQ